MLFIKFKRMTASIEDFKPEIENHLRYLQAAAKRKLFSRKKPESKQTGEVIDRLAGYLYHVYYETTNPTLVLSLSTAEITLLSVSVEPSSKANDDDVTNDDVTILVVWSMIPLLKVVACS